MEKTNLATLIQRENSIIFILVISPLHKNWR